MKEYHKKIKMKKAALISGLALTMGIAGFQLASADTGTQTGNADNHPGYQQNQNGSQQNSNHGNSQNGSNHQQNNQNSKNDRNRQQNNRNSQNDNKNRNRQDKNDSRNNDKYYRNEVTITGRVVSAENESIIVFGGNHTYDVDISSARINGDIQNGNTVIVLGTKSGDSIDARIVNVIN